MRRQFFFLLIITLLASGAYFYFWYAPKCDTPITYRLGDFDVRFNISKDQAKEALLAAETVWEKPSDRNLFTYDENSNFPVDFLFDDRQERTLAEEAQREALDTKEAASAEISEQYTKLTTSYAELEEAYASRLSLYDKKLTNFNATVAKYNEAGGAPPAEYAQLEKTKRTLKQTETTLQAESKNLAAIASQINTLSDRGNRIIEQYNQNVQTYNKNFGHGGEFTQGDYKGKSITIYKFSDTTELTTVLAHEFGHALGISHVEGSSSIMYYLLEDQPKDLVTTSQDMDAFRAVCTLKTGFIGKIDQFIKTISTYNYVTNF